MRYILGVDPGLSGGLALYDPMAEIIITRPMPTIEAGSKSKRVIDESELARFVDEHSTNIKKVVIEKVHAMPKQGVTSTFNFGMGYGIIRGIVSANFLPVEYITPQEWKKALHASANKDSARERASELFPRYSDQWNLKKWDGRAEAAMIAYYGSIRK